MSEPDNPAHAVLLVEDEPGPDLSGLTVKADEHGQAARVAERDAGEVEDHARRSGGQRVGGSLVSRPATSR